MAAIDYANDKFVIVRADGTVARLPATTLGSAMQPITRDGENRVVDPTFTSALNWSSGGTIAAGDFGAWGQDNVIDVTGAASTYTSAASRVFTVTPGEKLFASVRAAVAEGSGATAYLTVYVSATPNMASPTQLYVAGTTSATPVDMSGFVTVPTGVRYAQCKMHKSGAGAVTACRFSLPRVVTDITPILLGVAIDLTAS